MKKIDELKKDLERGDYKLIHRMTRVSLPTINAIFQGSRNAETPAGRKIRLAAQKLIDSRNELFKDAEAQPEPGFSRKVA